jgi:flagellar biosynthetic protein FliO
MRIAIAHFPILILALWQGEVGAEQFQSGSSLLWMFVQTILALGFVCLLAYVVLRVVLPRLQVGARGQSMVKVIDRTPLDQRRSLFVVEVTGRWLLLGSSEGGVELISELDAEKAAQEAETMSAAAVSTRARATFNQATTNARTAFAEVFARRGNRRP